MVAVLAAGSVLVIDAGRDQRSAPAVAVAGPTSSQPRAADQDGTWLPPTGRYPDASEVTGVLLGPVPKTPSTAQGLISLANGPYLKLKDGKPHTVVLAYYPALGSTAVLVPSMEGVRQASCPPAFEVHSGHAYYISCTDVVVLPGVVPKFVLAIPYNTVGGGGFTTKANLY